MHGLQARFVDWTLAIGLAEQTAKIRHVALDYFIRWCDVQHVCEPSQITRSSLEAYQGYLHHFRKVNGDPLALTTQATRLNPLKAFCKWLVRERYLAHDPSREMLMPRLPRQLPRRIPTVEDVQRVLSQPDLGKLGGIRDRAMLEILYSTAVRRMELTRLHLVDVNLAMNTLMVRGGKGRRDRFVPIGGRAAMWVEAYLSEVRPSLATPSDRGVLFLTDYGEPFAKNRLGDNVKRYLSNAGITAPGACHLFRHACATHMLENGADIRYIQAMLGHADLSTTQIYTQVSITKLKEIHAATHPSRLRALNDDAHSPFFDYARQRTDITRTLA